MKKTVENHLTLRERILATIREAIMNGSLKPGEKIAEPELAARFGISRTPIREAFRQLESEGYLTVIPRKGALVAAFSAKDVEEFYAIKSILEGYAARKACERLSPKDLAKLEKINEKLRAIADEGDVNHFFKVHNSFHELFIKGAGNEKLAEMIFGLLKKFQRLRLASLAKPGRMHISVEEHDKIIDAFRSKNSLLAEALVQKNAEYGGRVLIDEEPMGRHEDGSPSAHMDL